MKKSRSFLFTAMALLTILCFSGCEAVTAPVSEPSPAETVSTPDAPPGSSADSKGVAVAGGSVTGSAGFPPARQLPVNTEPAVSLLY